MTFNIFPLYLYTAILLLFSCTKDKTDQDCDLLPQTGVYLQKEFTHNGFKLPYRILFPPSYDGNQKFPILFFLHGAGERGNDNTSQLSYGSQLFLDSINEYPCIIIYPQCAANQWWANNSNGDVLSNGFPLFNNTNLDAIHPSIELLELLIDSLATVNTVDTSRIYIAGLSMGGMGTSQMLAKRPDFFAAGIVMAGIAPLNFSAILKQTPTWIFHGLQDNIVSPSHSSDYFLAIDDSSQTHKITQYSGVGHSSWLNAFAEPDFLNWIFSKNRE